MILVTGATGLVGRHLIRRLMRAAVPLRCLLTERQLRRLPWDAAAPYAPEIVVGSLQDDEASFRAVTGCHAVIHLSNAFWWGGQRDLDRLERVGTANLATAARASRVGRIITVSQLGASPSSAYSLHRVKGQMESLLRNSGVAYTIIRSGIVYGPEDAFINHIAGMLRLNPLFFFMPGRGEAVLHPIYIDDLVEALYRSLSRVRLVDATVEIGGAEYMSLLDLIRTVMRVTGMRRAIVPLPPYLLRATAGFYSLLLPRALMTSQWLDILAANRAAPLSAVFDYFGFLPRRFEETLLDYLPQQRHLGAALRASFRRPPRID
ncbi:MAG: NAD(P)H-binding protein [Chloroflexi bacterium]|nr:NAD(P)H-binding protein [Chloroflexota bacterium]MCY4246963.1 NAD(P)H-binding protein [Chloroflexota bacterium]